MHCAICGIRRPRRFCPGVRGDICPTCCGAEREVTVDCPLDCEYLQEARKHEKPLPLDPEHIPNPDIRVSHEFVEEHQALLAILSGAIARAALQTPGVVDADVKEALAGLAQTYRTLESGVYYESRPGNHLAAAVFSSVQAAIPHFREAEQRRYGLARTRDSDVLKALVVLQRLEMDRNNGRRRGRAFIDLAREFYEAGADSEPAPASSLILP